jgi:hypothetical protein
MIGVTCASVITPECSDGFSCGLTVARSVAGVLARAARPLSKAVYAASWTTLQNLCGVVTPRSVGSTPAPLRQAVCGFRKGLAGPGGWVADEARCRLRPLEAAWDDGELWRECGGICISRTEPSRRKADQLVESCDHPMAATATTSARRRRTRAPRRLDGFRRVAASERPLERAGTG